MLLACFVLLLYQLLLAYVIKHRRKISVDPTQLPSQKSADRDHEDTISTTRPMRV